MTRIASVTGNLGPFSRAPKFAAGHWLLSGRPHTAGRGSRRRTAWVPARRRRLHPKAPQPYRFAGGYQDPTGLYHYGARYYDPRIGRFISPDPSGQEKNPYLYAEDDPVNRIDPDGTSSVGEFSRTPRKLWASMTT
ncbi:hypothetical protein GCM10018773_57520 [Streptomyces candidus]|nr:RHS repeat-associated core domain-containing protein [Streptomyces candidus]GHH54451.1 hypothetical protein GCM10018773_57520 [Streptomyces candidus]